MHGIYDLHTYSKAYTKTILNVRLKTTWDTQIVCVCVCAFCAKISESWVENESPEYLITRHSRCLRHIHIYELLTRIQVLLSTALFGWWKIVIFAHNPTKNMFLFVVSFWFFLGAPKWNVTIEMEWKAHKYIWAYSLIQQYKKTRFQTWSKHCYKLCIVSLNSVGIGVFHPLICCSLMLYRGWLWFE